jgi:hypothetical protein
MTRATGGDPERDRAAVRVVYGLLGLCVFIVLTGIVGSWFDHDLRIEVAALGVIIGAIVTLLVGKSLINSK